MQAFDAAGRPFEFDSTAVKSWKRPPLSPAGAEFVANDEIYLVNGQWYRRYVAGRRLPAHAREVTDCARYLMPREARGWFLTAGMEPPDELAEGWRPDIIDIAWDVHTVLEYPYGEPTPHRLAAGVEAIRRLRRTLSRPAPLGWGGVKSGVEAPRSMPPGPLERSVLQVARSILSQAPEDCHLERFLAGFRDGTAFGTRLEDSAGGTRNLFGATRQRAYHLTRLPRKDIESLAAAMPEQPIPPLRNRLAELRQACLDEQCIIERLGRKFARQTPPDWQRRIDELLAKWRACLRGDIPAPPLPPVTTAPEALRAIDTLLIRINVELRRVEDARAGTAMHLAPPPMPSAVLARLTDLAARFAAGRDARPNVWLLIAAGDRESWPSPLYLYMRAQSAVWRRWESRPQCDVSNPEHGARLPVVLRRREAPQAAPAQGQPPSCDESAHFFGAVADIDAFVAVAESAGGLLDRTYELPSVSPLLAGAPFNSAPLARWIDLVYATLTRHQPTLILRTPPTSDVELYVLDIDPWEASVLTIRLLQEQSAVVHHAGNAPGRSHDVPAVPPLDAGAVVPPAPSIATEAADRGGRSMSNPAPDAEGGADVPDIKAVPPIERGLNLAPPDLDRLVREGVDLRDRMNAPPPEDPLAWLHDALKDLATRALQAASSESVAGPLRADVLRVVDPITFGRALAAARAACSKAGVGLGDMRRTLDAVQRAGGSLLGWASGEARVDLQTDAQACLSILAELMELRAWIGDRRSAADPKKPSPAGGTAARLQIEGSTVLLDGAPVALGMTEESRGAAVCYLTHLLAAGGDWRSGTELDEMEAQGPCKAHAEVRWDRVRKSLPACLHDLTETNRRKGNRLSPAAWRR